MSKIDGVNQPKPNQAKNYVINGNFDFWQRGTSGILTSTDTAQYKAADRFYTYRTSSTALTMSQQVGDFSTYAARFQRTAADTSTTTMYAGQVIETAESVKLAGKIVTLSFYAKAGANYSSSGSGLGVIIVTGTGTDQGSQGSIAGTWTTYSISSNTTKTITTSATRYSYTATIPSGTKEIAILFYYSGTGTAGANDWFQLEQIMLNEGPVAAPFQIAGANAQAELGMCQRYYEKSYDLTTAPGTNTSSNSVTTVAAGQVGGGAGTSWITCGPVSYKSTKRTTPTVTLYTTGGTSGQVFWYPYQGSGSNLASGASSYIHSFNVSTSTNNGTASWNQAAFHYTADAEL